MVQEHSEPAQLSGAEPPVDEATRHEEERIRAAYARYDASPAEQAKRDLGNPGTRLIIEQRDAELRRALMLTRQTHGPTGRILDVGCGNGYVLAHLIQWGEDPTRLAGIDLLPDRVARTQAVAPGASVIQGSASELPYADRAFVLLIASTLFSSILDPVVARRVAREMLRVLAPSGFIFWFDNRYPNPSNNDVRGWNRRDIRHLFGNCEYRLRSTTLAPPVARRLGRTAPMLYPLLAALPPLRVRLSGLIVKPPE